METNDTTRYVSLNTYGASRPVEGEIVTVLASSHPQRGLKLIASYSRALPQYSIHELIVTDETAQLPGGIVNKIAYLGFFEITRGGCIIVGQDITVDGVPIGRLLGFDETHEPNHINIVIGADSILTGQELHLYPGAKILFKK